MNKLIKILILIQIFFLKSSLAFSEYWGFTYKSATALDRLSYLIGGSPTDTELGTFKDSSGNSLSQSSEQSLGFDLYINKNQIDFFSKKQKSNLKMK